MRKHRKNILPATVRVEQFMCRIENDDWSEKDLPYRQISSPFLGSLISWKKYMKSAAGLHTAWKCKHKLTFCLLN